MAAGITFDVIGARVLVVASTSAVIESTMDDGEGERP